MSQEAVRPAENKMSTMPMDKLIINMSLPMMISMLVQALYNIVDSIFVAQISENALTAVSLAFPIQTLMIALGGGTGVGINALLSKSLGEKNQERADKAAINGIFLAVMNFLVFLLIGIFGSKLFFQSQTTNAEIVQYGVEYMSIICCFSCGLYAQFIFERLTQATGKTVYAMIIQGVGAILNIILDPILIFGLFGAPKMGVAGAAAATVIGQCIAGIFGLYLNIKKNRDINIKFKGFRPDAEIIKNIYVVGVPSIIMQSIGSIMTYGMNQILIAFTSTATAVFGVYFKLQSFIFMPVFGLNNGLIPIIAYNFGARNRERMTKSIKLGISYAVCIMAVGTVIFMLFPVQMLRLFDASDAMIEIGVPALRIISIPFIMAGYCIVCGTVFQAVGKAFYSLMVSLCRQLLVLLPVAFILAKVGGLNAVWWAFPIAELVSLMMTTIFIILVYRKIIKPLDKE